MNRILFFISTIGLVFSGTFVIVSVWNNTDWLLLERGYYTFGTLTVAIVTYLAIQQILNFNTTDSLGRFNTVVTTSFAIVSLIFMVFSIRNTEWVLLEKGYYWLGIGFVLITSAMLSATIPSVMGQEQRKDSSNNF